MIKSTVIVLTSIIGGTAGGYYGSTLAPIQPQIAIVDIQGIIQKSLDKNPKQTEQNAQELTDHIKAVTDDLVQQGVVVLDAQSVINAPEEAYVQFNFN